MSIYKRSDQIKRNYEIFRLRGEGHTYQELGDLHKISKQRAHQIVMFIKNKEMLKTTIDNYLDIYEELL